MALQGILLVDKPTGMTSHKLVLKIRKPLNRDKSKPRIKVGHTGTLDYAAHGLMILVVGKATKSTKFFQGLDKEYRVVAELGKATDTYDREGKVVFEGEWEDLTESEILEAASQFEGTFPQTPPDYSAKKIGGKKAYQLAKKGKEVKLDPKMVTVYDLEVEKIDLPYVTMRIECSSGTYIRSIVKEMGDILGSGGYVAALERLKIAHFDLSQAYSLEELQDKSREGIIDCLYPLEKALESLKEEGATN